MRAPSPESSPTRARTGSGPARPTPSWCVCAMRSPGPAAASCAPRSSRSSPATCSSRPTSSRWSRTCSASTCSPRSCRASPSTPSRSPHTTPHGRSRHERRRPLPRPRRTHPPGRDRPDRSPLRHLRAAAHRPGPARGAARLRAGLPGPRRDPGRPDLRPAREPSGRLHRGGEGADPGLPRPGPAGADPAPAGPVPGRHRAARDLARHLTAGHGDARRGDPLHARARAHRAAARARDRGGAGPRFAPAADGPGRRPDPLAAGRVPVHPELPHRTGADPGARGAGGAVQHRRAGEHRRDPRRRADARDPRLRADRAGVHHGAGRGGGAGLRRGGAGSRAPARSGGHSPPAAPLPAADAHDRGPRARRGARRFPDHRGDLRPRRGGHARAEGGRRPGRAGAAGRRGALRARVRAGEPRDRPVLPAARSAPARDGGDPMTTSALISPGPAAPGPAAPPVEASRLRVARRPLPPAGVLLSLAVLVVVLAWSLAPGLLTRHDPAIGIPDEKFTAPGWEHWLGTDHLGRDLLARIVHGSASSMTSALIAVGIGVVLGGLLGLLGGYLGGWVDSVISRVVEVLLAIPGFLLAVVVVTALGFDTRNAAIATGISAVAVFARLMRAEVLRVRTSVFLE